MLGVLLGCQPKQTASEEAVFQQSQRLFETYLEGDAASAKQSLEKEIELLENGRVPLYMPRQATVLFAECSRLYALEKRLGNDTSAELALIKARYWNLRRYEADGNLTTNKLDELRSFTPEKILKTIDASDKLHTQGKGPRYNRPK